MAAEEDILNEEGFADLPFADSNIAFGFYQNESPFIETPPGIVRALVKLGKLNSRLRDRQWKRFFIFLCLLYSQRLAS